MKRTAAKVITVLGAEATGKTELINALATAHPTLFTVLHEPLRQFCEVHSRVPNALEQAQLMNQHASDIVALANTCSTLWLLCDCAPITTALYSHQYYQQPHLIDPATLFHQQNVNQTWVIRPEFAWVADPNPIMRDGPAAQQQFDTLLMNWLEQYSISPLRQLKGSTAQRLNQAIAAII